MIFLLLGPQIYVILFVCRFLRINLPAGGHPVAVVFSDDASSVVVASQTLSGCALYLYGEEKPNPSDGTKQQTKLPLPEIKWERHKIHDKRGVLTLSGTPATYGSADGSTIIASCSEGISYPASNILCICLGSHVFDTIGIKVRIGFRLNCYKY